MSYDTLAQAVTDLSTGNSALVAAVTATQVASNAAATSATASKVAAADSATSAATSAASATTSQASASASKSAANASELNAGNSAAAALTSSNNSAASAGAAATSASNAATSEVNALTSKNAAATSATNAGTSETNALASKNAAATSATTATNQASAASTSASGAATSATAADGSKTAAASSATAAASSATSASGSATTATNQASAASTSAGNAATSATTATNQASAANASAGNAATSATTATNQASAASTSASNAANSASQAATSATNAANSLANKQDKADNLTALAGLTGVADKVPYFTGAGALSLAAFTAKARALSARTDTAGMQAELGLVPVSSLTDVTAGRVTIPGWMGLGGVAIAANSGDFNALGSSTGFFVVNNGTNGPISGGSQYVIQINASTGYLYQQATDVTTARTWERQLMATQWQPWLEISKIGGNSAALTVGNGGTGVTSLPVPFTRLRDSQALTYTEATAERLRMKTFEPINFITDLDDTSTAQVRGPGYVSNTTVGTKPGGYVYGVVNTILITADTLCQTFDPLTGTAGVTYPQYRRQGYGTAAGKWGPWRMVIDSSSALLDPASGGVMMRTVVSGIALTKYLDGRNIANGTFLSATATVAANAITAMTVTLPFSIGTDDNYSTANLVAQPSITYDHYGVVSCFFTGSGTVLNFVIRNGATAQTFNVRGIITGHWK